MTLWIFFNFEFYPLAFILRELRERRAAVATLEKKAEAAAATAEKEGRRRLEAELRAESERRTELENCISDLRYAMSQAEEQYSK